MSYLPREGLQYVWTEGQEKSQIEVKTYEDKSFNLIGFDWDGLVKDSNLISTQTVIRDQVPLLESEVLSAKPDYDLTILSGTVGELKPGQIVKVAEGEIYRYQGPVATHVDLGSVDFSDSSQWVAEVEPPAYVKDAPYTIQYVMADDTDVELIPNITIVKVVANDQGERLAAGGVVGNSYRYIGEPAEVVLSEQDYSVGQHGRTSPPRRRTRMSRT